LEDGGPKYRFTEAISLSIDCEDQVNRYLGDPDREKANRVIQAMLKMWRIVVADLDRAAAGA
jgi:predicted 3-demethylubiquinone-9 3-methyltransferase (glyoxalase superfamily)